MSYDDNGPELGRFEYGIVRRKVRQIIGRAGFMPQDAEWLQQELILRILQSLPSIDPSQAHRNVFTTTVVERYVANILRDKRAQKRDYRRIGSLNVSISVTDEGPTELSETIGQRELDARRQRHPRSDEDFAQLMSDLADAITKLPGELRDLAERLKSQSVSEIAREMGVPRTTLNSRIARIRQRFEKAGLRQYLRSSSSPPETG